MGTKTEKIDTFLATIGDGVDSKRLAALAASGVRVCHLEGGAVAGKAQFLDQIAAAMEFPDYFGRNWDALSDCLTDLAWIEAREVVLVYDRTIHFADNNPEEWAVALEILRSAQAYWAREGPPGLHLFLSETPVVFT